MEEWKEIKGFKDYKISNNGNVFSKLKNRNITPYINESGYYRIRLSLNGKIHHKTIHRLVALAFIENKNNLPEVNHKDENKLNNNVENLEWCTKRYNILYGTALERTHKANLNCKTTSKSVLCVEKGDIYPSIREAERK